MKKPKAISVDGNKVEVSKDSIGYDSHIFIDMSAFNKDGGTISMNLKQTKRFRKWLDDAIKFMELNLKN